MLKFKKTNGFTLIETLVVISIISFIASSATYAANNARMKARDAKRMADLEQIRKAMEMYYQDNGTYPDVNMDGSSSLITSSDVKWNNLQAMLNPYLSKLPVDPINISRLPFLDGGYQYFYLFNPAITNKYDLVGQLENRNNENICKFKCWRAYVTNNPTQIPWCGGSCPDGGWWATNVAPGAGDYIYANH